MATKTKTKTVGEKTPTKSSYVTEITEILKEVEKEVPSKWNEIKIKALKIFLSACKYVCKQESANDKLNKLINNK